MIRKQNLLCKSCRFSLLFKSQWHEKRENRNIWNKNKYFTYQTLLLLFLFPELYSIAFVLLCIWNQKAFYHMHATYFHLESKIFSGILCDPGCPLKSKANKKEGPYHCIFGTIDTHRCATGLTNFICIRDVEGRLSGYFYDCKHVKTLTMKTELLVEWYKGHTLWCNCMYEWLQTQI